MLKKRMLITGVSGLLGNALAAYFSNKYEVIGWYSAHEVFIPGVMMRRVDLVATDYLEKVVAQDKPDIVIHCASLTNVDFCERHKELTDLVNITATENLLKACGDEKIKFVYISTDAVYDGVKGGFTEADRVAPLNHYGKSKYAGENAVRARANALILRTNIFGFNIQDKQSIGEWVISELAAKRPIKGFKDAYFSSIYTYEFARVLEKILAKDLKGTYNCAASSGMSKYHFACLLAKKMGADAALVSPVSIDDFPFTAQRGKNLTMNVEKLEHDLGVPLPGMEEYVDKFYHDHIEDVKGRIASSQAYPHTERISYGRQTVDESDIAAVVSVLKSSYLTQGPMVEEFEKQLCAYTGARFAVAVNSGTAALHIACLAAGVTAGDEVITSPITFVASANCAAYCGARPVFADIDPQTHNITAENIAEKINKDTKAVIPVHFAGQSCLMDKIAQAVKESENKFGKKIYIIEDASHALGSEYKGYKVGKGTYSDMTVLSFHPVKHITTGEGGAVLTNDEVLYKKLKALRSHGITNTPEDFTNQDMAFSQDGKANPWYYEQQYLGYNYRITDIQCALGVSQLKKIDCFLSRRRKIVDFYNQAFGGNELFKTPAEDNACISNWHLYVLRIDFSKTKITRAQLMHRLREKNIFTQVHYIPVHLQPYYQKEYGYKKGDHKNAERYYEQALSLPLYPALTQNDLKIVTAYFLDIIKG